MDVTKPSRKNRPKVTSDQPSSGRPSSRTALQDSEAFTLSSSKTKSYRRLSSSPPSYMDGNTSSTGSSRLGSSRLGSPRLGSPNKSLIHTLSSSVYSVIEYLGFSAIKKQSLFAVPLLPHSVMPGVIPPSRNPSSMSNMSNGSSVQELAQIATDGDNLVKREVSPRDGITPFEGRAGIRSPQSEIDLSNALQSKNYILKESNMNYHKPLFECVGHPLDFKISDPKYHRANLNLIYASIQYFLDTGMPNNDNTEEIARRYCSVVSKLIIPMYSTKICCESSSTLNDELKEKLNANLYYYLCLGFVIHFVELSNKLSQYSDLN